MFGKTKRIAALEGQVEALERQLHGKQDTSDPGWNTLYGTDVMKAEAPWKTYTTKDYEGIYGKHEIVGACVRELMTSAAEAPAQVGKVTPEGEFEPTPNHLMQRLLDNPNSIHDGNLLTQYEVIHLMLTGTSHTWKWRNAAGYPNELWPIPSSWVALKTQAGSDPIMGFTIKQGTGPPLTIAANDMLYMFLPDPQNGYKGIGPLQQAAHAYELDADKQATFGELLDNLDMPGLIMKFPKGLSEKDKLDVRHQTQDKAGKGKRGNTLFLTGEGADATVDTLLKDLDWPGFDEMSESRICMAFGVSPILIGARLGLMRGSYSRYEAVRKSFYRETMLPLWGMLGRAKTRGLLRAEGDNEHIIRFDLSEIAELREDAVKQAERADKLFNGSIIMRSEARKMAGLPPLDEKQGEVFLIKTNTMEVPLSEYE